MDVPLMVSWRSYHMEMSGDDGVNDILIVRAGEV